MSATMCAYTAAVPEGIYAALLEARVNDLIHICRSDAPEEAKLVDLRGLGIDTEYIFDSNYWAPDEKEDVKSFIDHILLMVDDARQFVLEDDQRDLVTFRKYIGGQWVSICFAGEMSWGDEPEGDGYKMLKAISQLGIGEMFEEAVNWGPAPADARTEKDEPDQ